MRSFKRDEAGKFAEHKIKQVKWQLKRTTTVILAVIIGIALTVIHYEYQELKGEDFMIVVKEVIRIENKIEEKKEKSEKKYEKIFTNQDKIKLISKEQEVDWKIIYAICKKESNCNSRSIGDGGNSYGAYQIHMPSHPNISPTKAQDFDWATRWTINRLKGHAETGGWDYAIRRHNGGMNDQTARYLVDVKNLISKL